jgi:hypothetical protein
MTILPADLDELGADLHVAATRIAARARIRHRAVVAVSVLVVLGAFGGVAVAAANLLGGTAPAEVQTDLHRAARLVWNGHSRLQLQTAVVVAQSRDATLYSVRDEHGNYCAELVGTSKALLFGFTCKLSRRIADGERIADDGGTSVQYALPRDGVPAPVVEFGRLPQGTVAARAVFANGTTEKIPLGLDGFYVYEPRGPNQALARRLPLTLEFLDRAGRPVWSYYTQPAQPLFVEGAGPHRISGRVEIVGARMVRVNVSPNLSAPSTIIDVAIARDGSFTWTGRPGQRVYNVTVVDGNGLPVSTNAQPLSVAEISEMSALARKRR